MYHTGSFYDRLRIGKADEFDLNLILDIKELLPTLEVTSLKTHQSCPKSLKSFFTLYYHVSWGSGCESVGRAVASNTRYLQFEYSHRQLYYYQLY